jgi:transcriptional/translational regulatory protein YebC/TACO1
LFKTKGLLDYDASKYTEDQIMEAALDAGADDVVTNDDVIEVTTSPADFPIVQEAMEKAGFQQESGEIEKIADQMILLDKEKAQKVMKIVEKLEDLEDVQNVATNLELPDDYEDPED